MNLSVVIPVYNSGRYIEKCLLSLLSQSFQDFEIILIDDGSEDDSRQKAEAILAGWHNHLILSQKNRGAAAARNAGILQAKGQWITFVDSDDNLAPEYFENLLKSSENYDLLVSGIVFMEGEKETHRTIPPDDVCRITDLRQEKGFYLDYTISPVGKLYRKRIIEKHLLRFNETLKTAEDRDFNIHYLFHTESIRFLPYAGYYYRTDHEGSLSKRVTIDGLHTDILYWNDLSRLMNGTNDAYLAHRLFYFIVDNISDLWQKKEYWTALRALRDNRPLFDRAFLRRNLKDLHAPEWQKTLLRFYLG